MEKLVLIDGNSLLNRAFYATPVFTTKDGLPTNAVFGFIKLLFKILSDKKPTHLVVAFDVHAPTFRHQAYGDYKAGRKPMPEDLVVQMPVLKDLLQAMHICICEKAGYEADDVIGTLAKRFPLLTYVYTGDRDAYQLVDETTNVCFTRKGVSDLLELTAENFQDEVGLRPAQIIDLKALMGDKSDNIPGVAGIGEKTAYSLLEKYGDLDEIYEHIDEIGGALHRKLTEGKKDAYFSKDLATIRLDAPVELSLCDCVLKTPFSRAVKERFTALEFRTLLTKNIFEEEGTEEETKTATETNLVEERLLSTVEEGVRLVQDAQAETIAACFEEGVFRFYFVEKQEEPVEFVYPIKVGLLDVGFYDYQLVPLLKAVYEGTRRIISYNVKDTMHALATLGVNFTAPYDDVSILKCLADGLSNSDSLAFCLQYYGVPEKHTAYGLSFLYERYTTSLNRRERLLYERVELPLVRVLYDMEVTGICVDLDTLESLSARYNEELAETVERIYELAGERFNLNSTQQLGKILFEKLNVGEGKKKNKESKSYKTTAEELEKYADESEAVRLVLRYRKIQKINSTYIEGFKPLLVNGKVHTTYNQANTQTGRLSSERPNIQNIPIRTEEGRELRRLFQASKGNVLVDADYSQIELRLLAHFSRCEKLTEAYCKGEDIHAMTASQVFGVPLEEVTSEMRREAKAVNFGIIYGISAYGLSNDLHITTKKAKEYIDKYFERYAEVKSYMNGNVEKATEDGYVETLLGRKRVINELKSSNYNVRSFGERAAMNMPLQGSSADIIKVAMIGVYRALQEGGYRAKLVLQVHDELVIDCPKEEAEAVTQILKREMENAAQLRVPLIADVRVGKSWFDAK